LAPDAVAPAVRAPSWVALHVEAPEGVVRDRVIQMLMEGGAGAVQELGSALQTHLIAGAPLDALCSAVTAAGATVRRTDLGEVDWGAQWVTRVGVQRIGRIAVAPPWMRGDIADSEIPIVIEPAMAFGTGEHETTRGVLALMQNLVEPDMLVADLGSGSGVLAIAAAKLGADRVVAIEMDPDAIGNALENVERNGVSPRVTVARAREHHLVRDHRALADHLPRASLWRKGRDRRHSRDRARPPAGVAVRRWLDSGIRTS